MSTTLDAILSALIERHGSDLHLKAGRPPLFRISGSVVVTEFESLDSARVSELVLGLMSESQLARLDRDGALDFSYAFSEDVRFRVNAFRQRGMVGAVLRAVPMRVPSLAQLRMPAVVADICLAPAGLVLVTGPTGSGKSTTLAAMINHINEHRQAHIITIEDPIEFVYADRNSILNQREVGVDAPTFAAALRHVLRQDPDVILIGEMRDPETIATAVTAAETGHLVFSTLHTNSAAQTIDRVVDAFQPEQQRQIRGQLAQVLRAVVSQRLVPAAARGGRVAAVEIMTQSPQVQKLITDGDIQHLHRAIEESGGYYRMRTMNQSLAQLVKQGLVTLEAAEAVSTDIDEMRRFLRMLGYDLPA
jgi:twitching motility protein PilT